MVTSGYLENCTFCTNRHSTKKTRDVRNGLFLFLFGIGSICEKNLDSVCNEFGSVKKARFSSDIIVTYYSCDSRVVNLQQMLQLQWMT